MRRTLEIVAVFALAFMVAPLTHAQTPTNTQKVSWVAPTQYTDGTSIPSTVAITYNVYAKFGTAAETKIRSAITVTSISTGPFPVGQNNCYAITTLTNGEESARVEGCGLVRAQIPKPATAITIR